MALFDLDRRIPRFFHLAELNAAGCPEKRTRLEVFCEQIVDSLIVGAIGGITSFVGAGEASTLQGFVVAFGLAFLIKMKEYRKIK